MAQWWERSVVSRNVVQVPFRPGATCGFLRELLLSSLNKNQISKFQFDQTEDLRDETEDLRENQLRLIKFAL